MQFHDHNKDCQESHPLKEGHCEQEQEQLGQNIAEHVERDAGHREAALTHTARYFVELFVIHIARFCRRAFGGIL